MKRDNGHIKTLRTTSFFAVVLCSAAISLAGCGSGGGNTGGMSTVQAASGSSVAISPSASVKSVSTASAPAVLNALEEAHQDYLNSYEKYVRLLRESGPQTMDTLNALAEYQKKYQLYQRMMASSQGGSTTDR